MASSTSRRARSYVFAGVSVVLLACEPASDPMQTQNPVLTPDTGVAAPPVMTGGGMSSGGSSMDASSSPASTPDAGMAAPAAMDSSVIMPVTPAADAAAGDAALPADGGLPADGALPGDGGLSGGDGGGILTGPVMLPEPALPGPFGFVVEENVGKGFENTIDANDKPGNEQYCVDFALGFGQDEQQSRDFAKIPAGMNMALYTLYRPKTFEEGKKYPILSWGNGTCALPQGYHYLLEHLASHGFWVIAANTRFTGSGEAQKKGIDVMIALSKDPNHAAYNRVDAEKVGIFGHSQGGLSTAAAEGDTRVDTAVILNSGGGGARVPTYYVTGEQDLAPFLSELSYAGASAPAASINYKMSDHITLITEPMRIFPAVAAWFRYQLLGDMVGRDYFVGANCKLCNHASEWSYEAKNLK